jgi:hypothetical protein
MPLLSLSALQKLFEEDTPFGRVAKPFFLGNDDDFRNNRFKLIPKVVDGNMVVKMAVKDTPTLLGNKLKQYYYKVLSSSTPPLPCHPCLTLRQGDNYFELDVDVGSSSVARHTVGIALGYSKAIVVDMGFCLQVSPLLHPALSAPSCTAYLCLCLCRETKRTSCQRS